MLICFVFVVVVVMVAVAQVLDCCLMRREKASEEKDLRAFIL